MGYVRRRSQITGYRLSLPVTCLLFPGSFNGQPIAMWFSPPPPPPAPVAVVTAVSSSSFSTGLASSLPPRPLVGWWACFLPDECVGLSDCFLQGSNRCL